MGTAFGRGDGPLLVPSISGGADNNLHCPETLANDGKCVEDDEEFAVSVRSLGGEAVDIPGLRQHEPLVKLCGRVAEATGHLPWEVQLCLGPRFFQKVELQTPLSSLGIREGAELMCVRRQLVRLEDVGASRFNSAYFCTVSRVEEAGWSVLEVSFEVVGDMSLGQLQDPNSSRLLWASPSGEAWRQPARNRFEHYDRKQRIKGVLVYEEVPTTGHLAFAFGTSGYSRLIMQLGPAEGG
mmetsp:Transcript_9638/g.28454  ORF Transcript_9638/g.28454 Transcript_9638/m.28454 type:complete len:239 (-) Transcript_9638:8-724(-)